LTLGIREEHKSIMVYRLILTLVLAFVCGCSTAECSVWRSVLLPACGGRAVVDHETCEPGEWATVEGPPIAAAGGLAPFDPQVLAARVGPFPEGGEVEAVTIGLAPGWGCAEPSSVGAWSGNERPSGDARPWLTPPTWGERADLGSGFATARFDLPEPVRVEPGEYAWTGLLLAPAAACGASAQGPAPGVTWRWRGGAWVEEPATLLVRAEGCEVR
jgi:hypothetical protein